MFIKSPILVDTTIAGYLFPAIWLSEAVDLAPSGSGLASFHIIWRDCSLTFFLWRANAIDTFAPNTSPAWDDWTAEYRLLDPLWLDPVIGDPLSEHIVAGYNIGARYVRIGWSASNWAGANRLLQIAFYGEAKI